LPNTTIDKARLKYINLSGVKYLSTHSFRHSHASLLLANGIDIKTVSDRLGHKDVKETLNTYTHVPPNNTTRALKIISDTLKSTPN
jgi:integrase